MSPHGDQSDWKDTLNLPRTDFPMKANLPATEPAMIARWDEMRPVRPAPRRTGRARRASCCTTARPYANGQIHIGHALNKILKDLVVKSRSMAGIRCSLRAGLGLPWTADRTERRDVNSHAPDKDRSPAEFRRACRAFATKFVASQREDFKRLGIFGDWDATRTSR